MNNDANLHDDTVHSKKKIVQPKGKFEDFILELEQIVSVDTTIASIIKIVKKGFAGDISNEKIDNIYNILMRAKNSRFLMMKMVQDVSCGKLKSKIIIELVQNARRQFAKDSNFPFDKNVSLTAQFGDPDRKKVLESWVLGNLRKDELPIEWVQAAITSLLHEDMIDDDLEIIKLIVNEIVTQRKSKTSKAKNSNSLLACELSNIILQPKFNKAKLNKIFEITRLLDERSKDVKRELLDIKRQNDDLLEASGGYKAELTSATAQIKYLVAEKEIQEQEISRVNNLIEEEKVKNRDLENHWKVKLEQSLAGSQHALKTKLNHELSEIKLSISSESPNIAMALRRVAQMEQILERIGQSNG